MLAVNKALDLRCSLAMVFVLVHSGLAQAQGTPPAPPARPRPSLQDRFDAATKAWEKGDCSTAVPLFANLAGDPGLKPGSLAAAAVAMRRGDCLIRTEGQSDEGEALVAAALPGLRKAGAAFEGDVSNGENQLGVLAMGRWDHDTALEHFHAALLLEKGAARLATLSRIAYVTAFDGGREGLDATEEGLRLVQADGPKPNKTLLAQWHTLHARILLNQGQVKAGRAELREALALGGGEKYQIDLTQALLRADLAQAAMLDRDKDDAYKFMAQSGAGRIEKSPFSMATVIEPPACGPDTGLKPQDSAVVEFGIDVDGRVSGAQTIYAAGDYAKAAAFARAVSNWAWMPEDVKKIPAFFRAASRVEIRCTNTEGSAGSGSPLTPLRTWFTAWAKGASRPYMPERDKITTWAQLVAAAGAAQAKGDVAGELAARTILSWFDLRPASEVRASIDRAQTLVGTLTVATPGIGEKLPLVRSSAMVLLATSALDLDKREKDRHASLAPPIAKQDLFAFADDPRIAASPLAQDSALLEAATRRSKNGEDDRVLGALRRVADDVRLGDHHPLRQFAQLRMANDFARRGDLAQAQRLFAATGLSEEQCAFIGPRPALQSSGTSAADFPLDALSWGFEGWVRTEFDIKADGGTADVRAVVAYPPFIFETAAQKLMNGERYQSSFRTEGGAACRADQQGVVFKIPDNMNTVSLIKKKS